MNTQRVNDVGVVPSQSPSSLRVVSWSFRPECAWSPVIKLKHVIAFGIVEVESKRDALTSSQETRSPCAPAPSNSPLKQTIMITPTFKARSTSPGKLPHDSVKPGQSGG
ncbi:hypothetical protein ACJJTC_009036, partial [Scirpophaga incertulas]